MAGPAKPTSQEDVAKLLAEIDRLKAQLVTANTSNEEAVRRAMMIAQDNEEIPTGKKVKISVCLNPWVKDADLQKFETREVPTYNYKIDMPPVGGVDIKLNGQSYQHGQVYEFDEYTLRGVKEIVFRLREHDASLRDHNENAYRKPTNAAFSGKTMGRIH